MPDAQDDMDWEIRRKRLLHRAHYRGFKEADLILGGFAREHSPSLSHHEIAQFETLLDARDHDIYGWLTGSIPVPPDHDTKLLERLRGFRPSF